MSINLADNCKNFTAKFTLFRVSVQLELGIFQIYYPRLYEAYFQRNKIHRMNWTEFNISRTCNQPYAE